MKKCVIFGASSTGEAAYELLKSNYDIIAFSDNNSNKWGTMICDIEIIPPNALKNLKGVEFIIASVYYSSIYMQLRALDISDIKVFYCFASANCGIEKRKDYMLFELDNIDLRSGCKFDKDKIINIDNNFSLNYPLNPKKTKRVLFCAYIFPPIGGSGVQRSLKFVKYLRKFGYEPIVLTVGKNMGKTQMDYTLLDELDDDIEIISIDENMILPEMLSISERQEIYNLYAGILGSQTEIDGFYKEMGNKGFIPDNHIIWVNECLRDIESKISLSSIDIIFTTGNPFSVFFLGYYIKKKYHTKWVMDYRDPWGATDFYNQELYHYNDEQLNYVYRIEKSLINEADAVVADANGVLDDFNNKYEISVDKLIEITNGYDEEDFKGITKLNYKNCKFTICHNGTVYFNRNVIVVLEEINKLIKCGKIDKEKIQWIFNGDIDIQWKKKIVNADAYGIVVFNGYLKHLESLSSLVASDLLILCGINGVGTKIGYTGKVFEYLRSKVPILSLSTKGGVLDKVMYETGAGKNFAYEDADGIRSYILERYYCWDNGIDSSENVNETAIKEYSRENTTKKLAQLFDRLINE